MTKSTSAALAGAVAALILSAPAAHAQRGPWQPGWGPSRWDGPIRESSPDRHSRDMREGRVEVSRFVLAGLAAETLGHGPVAVESEAGDGPGLEPGQRATYEAAVVDALVGAGYDTRHTAGHATGAHPQLARLRISRRVLLAAEQKRSPVSGSAAMSVGTHGSAYGLALAVDMTRPRPALVSTRLDASIVDPADGRVLWEGQASITTPQGDAKWPEDRIAGKLATALFDQFPKAETMVAVPAGMTHVPPVTSGEMPGHPG